MGLLFNSLLPTIIPVIIGIIVPPVMSGVKSVAGFVDNQAAPIQQMMVAGIAWGLAEGGAALNVVLPTNLDLLTSGDMSGAIAAGIAFAIHAGSKSKS